MIASLLHGTPASASENGNIDLTAIQQALGVLLTQSGDIDGKLDTVNGNLEDIVNALKAINIIVQIPPGIPEDPVVLLNQPILQVIPAGQPLVTELVDFRTATRFAFKAESTLDQPITLQIVGDIFKTSAFRLVNIDGPLALPAGGTLSAGIGWGQWMPYVGVAITAPVAPTTGMLKIFYVRKNVEE